MSDDGRAPDSPRSSQSPVPLGIQGDLELELLGLANALYNLGTTVINDSTKERDNKPGQPSGDVKNVGLRVNEVIDHLATLKEMAKHIHTSVPIQVLSDIDNARNPMQLTRDRIERAAAENQFMNGKISAVSSYNDMLNQALIENFPELETHLPSSNSTSQMVEDQKPAVNGVAGPSTEANLSPPVVPSTSNGS